MKIEKTISDEKLKDTITCLLPKSGQYPFLLLTWARVKLWESQINWNDLQIAFDSLYEEGRINGRHDFSKSILKRAYIIK